MSKRNRQQRHNPRSSGRVREARGPAEPVEHLPREKKPPTRYGPPFILLEDQNLNTFHYKAGVWSAHPHSIADYRESSKVNLLPQQLNDMLRYEIRCPV